MFWPQSLIADNADVESSGRELITAVANKSACEPTVGGYRLFCSDVRSRSSGRVQIALQRNGLNCRIAIFEDPSCQGAQNIKRGCVKINQPSRVGKIGATGLARDNIE